MLTFFVCVLAAAPFSLWYLTNSEELPKTFGGWVVASIMSVPLTSLGVAAAFVNWLILLWFIFGESFSLILLYRVPEPLRTLILMCSLTTGAFAAVIAIRDVARWRAKRRTQRK